MEHVRLMVLPFFTYTSSGPQMFAWAAIAKRAGKWIRSEAAGNEHGHLAPLATSAAFNVSHFTCSKSSLYSTIMN
jgi:hypothetical protein